MKKKNAYLFGFVFLIISVVFSLMAKTFDVGAATETPGYKIGFAGINNGFHSLTGVNMSFYYITNIMGFIAIAIGLAFAFIGFLQLVIRKSFAKIDRFIYCLGGTYVLLGVIYVAFEKIIVNYRPIYMDGEIEASFPSSHTLLISVIIATAVIEANRHFADKKPLKITLTVIGVLFIAAAVILRLLSGVHWLTDIIASVFISTSITFFYYAASKQKEGKHSI